jgi:DNA polymerase III epsilon subunit-like protein
VVFDTLVRPTCEVYDYREWITGIKPLDLKYAPSFPKIAPIVKFVDIILDVVKENP